MFQKEIKKKDLSLGYKNEKSINNYTGCVIFGSTSQTSVWILLTRSNGQEVMD